MTWWTTTLGGAIAHELAPWAYWHARCMVLAWGVLLPLGALGARYWKIAPAQRWPQALDSKLWWHAHLALQWLGVVLMSVGVALAWGQATGASAAALLHAWAGWAVVVLGWLQGISGLARGSKGGPTDARPQGDHYDMSAHRRRFERWHKAAGWLCVLLALAVIALGLWLADAPRWMAFWLAIWWGLLALLAARWQRQGRCVDTYQAIWGPDPRHPGNHQQPIGWGVRRPQP